MPSSASRRTPSQLPTVQYIGSSGWPGSSAASDRKIARITGNGPRIEGLRAIVFLSHRIPVRITDTSHTACDLLLCRCILKG